MEINQHYFIGEAKFCWIGASRRSRTQIRRVEGLLNQAKRDIRKSRPYGQRRLAIVFVTPRVSKKRNDGVRMHIKQFVDQVTSVDADAVAWVFPDPEQSISYHGYIYPGTAVVIKEVKR